MIQIPSMHVEASGDRGTVFLRLSDTRTQHIRSYLLYKTSDFATYNE